MPPIGVPDSGPRPTLLPHAPPGAQPRERTRQSVSE